jgi:hypothetical protein
LITGTGDVEGVEENLRDDTSRSSQSSRVDLSGMTTGLFLSGSGGVLAKHWPSPLAVYGV